MASTKSRLKKLYAIKAGLAAAWENRDPQAAADIIAEAGTDQHWAMDAAFAVGFSPEYYADTIRVHLPVRPGIRKA